MKAKMIEAGKRLAALNPVEGSDEWKTLISARKWFAAGAIARYSYEDFDIHQAILAAIYRLEN